MFRASPTGPRAGIFEMDFFQYFSHVKHTLVTLQIILYDIGRTFHFYHFHTMFRASLTGPRAAKMTMDFFHYFSRNQKG